MKLKDITRDLKTLARYRLKIDLRYPLSYIAALFSSIFWLLPFSMLVILFTEQARPRMASLIAYGLIIYLLYENLGFKVGTGIERLQREGVLEQIFLTPVSPWILPLSLAATSLIILQMFAAVMLLFFVFFFGIPLIVGNVFLGVLSYLLAFLLLYGISLIFAAITVKIKKSIQLFLELSRFLFMLFCGAFYSFNAVPWQMKIISKCIPFSYAVDLFRTSLMGIRPELSTGTTLFIFTLPAQIVAWLKTTVLSIGFFFGGYAYYNSTIKDAKRRAYLGTY